MSFERVNNISYLSMLFHSWQTRSEARCLRLNEKMDESRERTDHVFSRGLIRQSEVTFCFMVDFQHACQAFSCRFEWSRKEKFICRKDKVSSMFFPLLS